MFLFDFTREPISITKPIRLIELFAGYGSQAMALKRIGAKFEHYRVVEFDKYAIASYNTVHGTDFPTMDITKVHAEDLNICDTNAFTYLLTYSFPCTDLSVAGKQAGMSKGSGTRSGLLWEVERILTEIRNSNGELPQILFMENVPQVHGKKNINDFEKWLGFLESLGYTNYWQDLNAKNYGVAQNRNRCFMFSFLGEYNYHFPQPIPLKKKLKDYLEDNVDEKYYINNEKADKLIKQLIDNGTLPQHNLDRVIEVMADVNVIGSLESKFESTNRIYDVWGCSPTLSTMQGGNQEPKILEAKQLGFMDNGTGKHQSNTVYDENALCPNITTVEGGGTQQIKVCESQIVAMRGRNPDNPSDRTAGSLTEQRLEVNMQDLSNCLTSVQKDNLLLENNIQKVGQISSNGSQCGTVISDNGISANLVAGTHGYVNSHIATQYRIRKLTPRECGRLMGVSDEDIDKMAAVNSNTQLYKQFGNSIVVDVMCAMFKNLNIKQGDSNEALQTN